LITDAPCHGNKYHDPDMGDKYPEGDPNGLVIEDQILEFIQNNINFAAISITKYTDKMYKILKDIYFKNRGRELQIAKLG
jgi:hypothetical protein